MIKVRAKHLPYQNGHLGHVAADMDHHGEPTVRVMEFDGAFCALEGSHRLALAHARGLMPKLVVEIADDDGLPPTHWRSVAQSLPVYEFDHAMVLKLADFNARSGNSNAGQT